MLDEIIMQSIMNIYIFNFFATLCLLINCEVVINGNVNNIKAKFKAYTFLNFYSHVVHDLCMHKKSQKLHFNPITCMGFEQSQSCFEAPWSFTLHPPHYLLSTSEKLLLLTLHSMHNLHKHWPSRIDIINKKIIFWIVIPIHLKFKSIIYNTQ
jgi:hypothetical protein